MAGKLRNETVTITGDFSELATALQSAMDAIPKIEDLVPRLPDFPYLFDQVMGGIRAKAEPQATDGIWTPHEVIDRLNRWNRDSAREMEAKRQFCELYALPIAAAIPSDDNYSRLFERTDAVANQLLKLEGPVSFSKVWTNYEVYRDAGGRLAAVGAARKANKSGGRPREKMTIDGEKLKELVGETPVTTFARLCDLSDDVVREACNHCKATPKTLRAICKYLRFLNQRS